MDNPETQATTEIRHRKKAPKAKSTKHKTKTMSNTARTPPNTMGEPNIDDTISESMYVFFPIIISKQMFA